MLKYSTGLRDKLNGLQAQVVGAIIGAGLTFVDGGASADSITDSGNGFVSAGFVPGQKLFVQGATTPANDSGITGERILSVTAGTITFATGSVDTGEAGGAGTVVVVAEGGSLKDVMRDGVIKIYSGSQPSSADAAVTGTLLMTVSVGSGAWVAGTATYGLEFEDDPTGGEIEKNSETWSGVGLADGTAGWFRFIANPTDDGTSSTTLPRIDGSVGTAGSDLVMASTSIVTGRTTTIDAFKITLPAYYGA
jgi:hypothetical protein